MPPKKGRTQPPPPPPPPDVYKLEESELKSLAQEYGLDPIGSKSSVLDRVIRYLKLTKNWKNPSSNAHKKRGKKKKNSSKNEKLQDDKEETEDVVHENVTVEIVPEVLDFAESDPAMAEFNQVFTKFHELSQRNVDQDEDDVVAGGGSRKFKPSGDDDDEDMDLDDSEDDVDDPLEVKQSKKKLRKLNRISVAQLKQSVEKPDLVEWVDVTSSEPLLLVALKATRNTVPVPSHWSKKSAYLSGKRGYEKPPFELPEYIKATGIMQIRQTNRGNIGIQAKARERAHPKLGRLDIDYQKLHDAFFRFQTKPHFSTHGDLYFEGREFDSGMKQKKPGVISDDLKIALNIPDGAPPPWLINMQRYGPPPSYPHLQIPGLNAPIPEGAQWGFHPGGWGKPPTDEYNRPLYGDVFATMKNAIPEQFIAPIESTLWGELEEEEYESSDEEDQEEEEEEEEEEREEQVQVEETVEFETGALDIETDHIELRKDARDSKRPTSQSNGSEPPKSLYTVLPQNKGSASSKGKFMSSTHTYSIPGKDVEVALNPEDLEGGMDAETLKRKYEESVKPSRSGPALPTASKEDLSDMVNEHNDRQSKKRSRRDDSRRDFKF